jgi:hypothetical protein
MEESKEEYRKYPSNKRLFLDIREYLKNILEELKKKK